MGDGTAGNSGDGGPASAALVSLPTEIRALPDGGYLIVDQGNSSIRRVSASGIITKLAGGTQGPGGDGGPATDAQLNAPNGAAYLPDGRLLIADSNNNRIRQVGLDGIMTTVAGGGAGGDGGPATSAQLQFPSDVLPLPDGSFLIAEGDGARVRKVDTSGIITTVVGNGIAGGSGDGGPATAAQVAGPSSLSATADGGYLITEIDGFRIRKVAADGTITTVAGTGTQGFSGDGGPATSANIGATNMALTVEAMPDGGFVIADAANQRVRRVRRTGRSRRSPGQGPPATTATTSPPARRRSTSPTASA